MAAATAMARLTNCFFMECLRYGWEGTSLGNVPVGTRTQVHVQGLGLGVVLGRIAPEFAADAAFAIAAERKLGMAFEKGVDPNRAGADAARRFEAGAEV